jgi:hypothetical protein
MQDLSRYHPLYARKAIEKLIDLSENEQKYHDRTPKRLETDLPLGLMIIGSTAKLTRSECSSPSPFGRGSVFLPLLGGEGWGEGGSGGKKSIKNQEIKRRFPLTLPSP